MANGSQIFSLSETLNHIKIKVDWSSTFDIAGNYSDVTVVVTVIRGAQGYNTNSTADLTQIWINGSRHDSRRSIGGASNTQNELARATQRVYHNSDGNKNIEIAVYHDFRLSFNGRWIGERSFTLSNQRLDSIPRLSDFTVPDTIVMGDTVTINIVPKLDTFDHRIRFRWHSRNDMVNDYIHSSVRQQKWTPTINYANDIPNSASSWGTLVVETWLNGVYLGENTKSITLLVPESIKPAFEGVTLLDTNATVRQLLNTPNYYIQAKSDVQVTYNKAVGSYGSNITGYRSEIIGTQYYADGNNGKFGVLLMNGEYSVRSYVIDSRGRQSEYKITKINVLEYYAPIGAFLVERTGSNKDKAVITLSSKVAPLNVRNENKNQMIIKVFSAQMGGNYELDSELTTTAVSEHVNQSITLKKTYTPNTTYTIKLEVWDRFTQLEKRTFTVAIETLEAEKVPFALHPHGFMVNTTEVKGSGNIKGDVHIDGSLDLLGNISQNGNYDVDGVVKIVGQLLLNGKPVQINSMAKDGSWVYDTCPKGTDFGGFLKSAKVPIGPSVIRDENTYSNFIIVKENASYIYGLAITQTRLETVRVTDGIYRGMRGWQIP